MSAAPPPAPALPWTSALSVAAALAVLAWAVEGGITDLGFFGLAPSWPAHRAPWVLGALWVGIVARWRGGDGPRPRQDLLLGLGLGLLTYPALLLPLLGLHVLTHAVVERAGASAPRRAGALITVHLALAAAAWRLPELRPLGVVFVAMGFFRAVAWLHDAQRSRFAPLPLLEYLRWQLLAPTWVIHPYLAVIPPRTPPRRPRPDAALAADGARLLWTGLGLLLLARALNAGLAGAWARPPEALGSWHLWSIADLLIQLGWAAGHAHVLVALLNLLGHDVAPSFRQPWRAQGLFDYWNRFIIHYKDLQVALLYLPTVMALKRRGATVAVLAGVAMTFLVGNNLMHLVGRYLFTGDLAARMPHAALQNLALTAVMGAALLWRERQGAAVASPRRGGFIGAAEAVARTYFTLAVVAWIWHL